MWWITFLLSGVILACALHVFPLSAALLFKKPNRKGDTPRVIEKVDVLIPCHNEEGRLNQTLESVQKAICKAQRIFPRISVNVYVGLDDCSDATLNDTHGFKATVFIFNYRSKWKVLRALVAQSTADWVAFVDAGTLWDERLLRNCLPYFAQQETICIAPSYHLLKKNSPSRLFWWLETHLKAIENASGGPISVHGATVFYQRKKLLETLDLLEGREWHNDDVAVPLALRITCPEERILYASNAAGGFAVYDAAPRSSASEKTARERIARGNIQWIEHLLPLARVWNKKIVFISMRRIFRLVWSIAPMLMLLSALIFIIEKSMPIEKIYVQLIGIGFIVLSSYFLLQRPTFASSLRASVSLLGFKKSLEDDQKWN